MSTNWKVGDVVQLKSGGAPFTLNEHIPTGAYGPYPVYSSYWKGLCISSGGLSQELTVHQDTIILYGDVPTPSRRYP